MAHNEQPQSDKQNSVLITVWLLGGVFLTLLLALLLSQTDGLQTPLAPPPTEEGLASNSTFTPRPTRILPTATNTRRPQATTPAGDVPSLLPRCDQLDGWTTYAVREGDTLSLLAARFRATISEVMVANCLEKPIIYEDELLYLPAIPPTREPCGPPSWWVYYRVQPYDTLYAIAVRTGTFVVELMKANCLTSDKITIGQLIYVPRLPVSVPMATNTSLPPTETATVARPSPTNIPTETSPPIVTLTPTELPASLTPTVIIVTVPPATPTPIPTNTPSLETPIPIPPPPTAMPTATPIPTTAP